MWLDSFGSSTGPTSQRDKEREVLPNKVAVHLFLVVVDGLQDVLISADKIFPPLIGTRAGGARQQLAASLLDVSCEFLYPARHLGKTRPAGTRGVQPRHPGVDPHAMRGPRVDANIDLSSWKGSQRLLESTFRLRPDDDEAFQDLLT